MSTLFETFEVRAKAVSAEVHCVPDRAGAVDFVCRFLEREQIADAPNSYAVWASGPTLKGEDTTQLEKRVPGLHFEVTRERAAAAKVGIGDMDWAIANTGTLVQDATPVERRLVSTLPTIHIAIAQRPNIAPDMGTMLSRLHPHPSGYISMITGPSRTADIERVLTIGVHGPKRLIIVMVGQPEEIQ